MNVCCLPGVISIFCSEFYFAMTGVGHRKSDLRRGKETARTGQLKDAFDVLCESASYLHQRDEQFMCEPHSQIFKFWDGYIEFALVLLTCGKEIGNFFSNSLLKCYRTLFVWIKPIIPNGFPYVWHTCTS